MSLEAYLWSGLGLVALVAVAVLDARRRGKHRAALARMSPEEREIAQREDKVFSSSVRRGR